MDVALLVAVVVLSVLCLLSLLLNFGVIRRLRSLEERMAHSGGEPLDMDGSGSLYVAAGRPVPVAGFTDIANQTHTTESLSPTLYGFFGPQCSTCHERLLGYLEFAAHYSGSIVNVVVRDGGDTDSLIAQLSPIGTLVVEDMGDSLTGAFQVSAFPVFILVDESGVVSSSGFTVPQTVA